MVEFASKKNRCECQKIFQSQNVRHFSGDKLEELKDHVLHSKNVVACALQETWKSYSAGEANVESSSLGGDFIVLSNGVEKNNNNSLNGTGVAIVLSPDGVNAFKLAGEQVFRFGERIIATRLHFKDEKGKIVKIFFVSVYAPHSGKSRATKDEFYSHFTDCLSKCNEGELLMVGGDFNASLGISKDKNSKELGQFGIDYSNSAGEELRSFMSCNNLCSATSFFKKKQHKYKTWKHFRSNNDYQIDYWLVRRIDLKRVIDAVTKPSKALYSDHIPVEISLRIAKSFKKKDQNSSGGGIKNWQELTRDSFDEFGRTFNYKRDEFNMAFKEDFDKRMNEYINSKSDLNWIENNKDTNWYFLMEEVLNDIGQKVLDSQLKDVNTWYDYCRDEVTAVIKKRNLHTAKLSRGVQCKRKLNKLRKRIQRITSKAKTDWIQEKVDVINLNDKMNPKEIWDVVKLLKGGFNKQVNRDCYSLKFRKEDGSFCLNDKENKEVAHKHFGEKVFDKETVYDVETIENLHQYPIESNMEREPSMDEMSTAISKLSNGKSPGENGIPAEAFKALLCDSENRDYLLQSLISFWRKKESPESWKIGKLKLLPKKGDLSDPNNWRGIMLLDIWSKVIASILSFRLQNLLDKVGMEAQNGFTRKKGCTDGTFSLNLLLNKRKDAHLDTHILFIDLKKAFDTVNREALFLILGKYGVPAHIISLIETLHSECKVNIAIGKETAQVNSTVGVKQGDNLAPVLFLFMMQAAMDSIKDKWPSGGILKMSNRMDACLKGRKTDELNENSHVNFFEFWCSLYADDAALVFESRAALIEGSKLIAPHLKKFGLEMHLGKNGKPSKSVALLIPAQHLTYDSYDTSDFEAEEGGSIHYVKEFKYLGSIIDFSLSSLSDIKNRIISASKVFGALRSILTSPYVKNCHKGSIYNALVLSILLYGCESWKLNGKYYSGSKITTGKKKADGSDEKFSLWTFHTKCVRTMCRVTMHQVKKYKLSSETLSKRLNLGSLDGYITTRTLNWVHKIVMMKDNRLPKLLLTSWASKRGMNGRTNTKTIQRSIHERILYAAKHPNCHPTLKTILIKLDTGKPYVRKSMLDQNLKRSNKDLDWRDLAGAPKWWKHVSLLFRHDKPIIVQNDNFFDGICKNLYPLTFRES